MKHKHAELMKLYAEDATETDIVWERWEYAKPPDYTWNDCYNVPIWNPDWEYRRKPKTVKMWQWVYTGLSGRIHLSGFYPNKEAVEDDMQNATVLQRAEWTEIDVQLDKP